ncbi:MAG: HlyD family type I secretion periplasmic adaptor subunit [Desulfovibrionaceae bacterium]|nr:HlyD family type I secretion periplasmic adaptor subunit [Desulfovibrionaceae bacterium]MDD4951326.1 HlyD family type I secretion periplasmic adaptor subunit [Desulfovibrionaceae bacterium]
MPEQGAKIFEVGRTTHLFFGLLTAFCLAFLIWACVAELDIVSEAVGEVIPKTRVKRVQHLEGGIVREIKVREGDTVKEGQALVVLESTASDSSVEELGVHVNALRVEIARLEAEENDLDAPDFPQDLMEQSPDLIKQARDLFEASRRRYQSDVSGYVEKVKQKEQDVNEIAARLKNGRKSLGLLQEQIAISASLLEDKLTTRYKHLSFLQEETNLKSRIEEDGAALERANSVLAAAVEQLNQVRNVYLEEIQKGLKKSRGELLEYEQRLRRFSDDLSRTTIRSPENGVVKSIYIVNVGEVVKPGKTIVDIVPAGDPLVIEARLAIGDIGYVAVGQAAEVKLASMDARRFGNLEGKVVQISPDAVSEPEGGTYYRVLVETDKDRFERKGHTYQLYPGMRVIVGIRIGQRTVMEYLAYPYFDSLAEGLREH